jgi:hypothetical protein
MERYLWFAALALPLLAVSQADAQIIKGVLGIRGAEMT